MMIRGIGIGLLAGLAMAAQPACGQRSSEMPRSFATGPVLQDHGPHAPVEMDMPLPADMKLAVAFDVAKGEAGALNRTLVSAARFINMHAANGVEPQNIRAAVVVHGVAVFDMANDAAYARKYPDQQSNPNAALIAALSWQGVDIIICGQSAAGQGLAKSELLPGVTMDLSAMTAHARLQQAGFTLNPF
ncbi:DsrE family protein [Alterisphingorhabdus coralli]|uniref:DsrE family protein n=1 Tax=Alterisphingorhabdus coralli TaxID=3071408 RepID=A0AA97I0R2_9SPHN|nr:DsrE family protein [Parasphingorhabdus sp. SCSIO 66989]WOE75257.1 DsrE family protein [Parasphingorhabdus sp. SCSIO 66989]